MLIEDKFNLGNTVITALHKIVQDSGGSYIDAAIEYSTLSGIEIEVVAEIIKENDLIKSNIEIEAEDLHFLKRTSRLPI